MRKLLIYTFLCIAAQLNRRKFEKQIQHKVYAIRTSWSILECINLTKNKIIFRSNCQIFSVFRYTALYTLMSKYTKKVERKMGKTNYFLISHFSVNRLVKTYFDGFQIHCFLSRQFFINIARCIALVLGLICFQKMKDGSRYNINPLC